MALIVPLIVMRRVESTIGGGAYAAPGSGAAQPADPCRTWVKVLSLRTGLATKASLCCLTLASDNPRSYCPRVRTA